MVREADLASGDLGGAILITPGIALPAYIKSALRTNRNAAIQALAIDSGGLEEDPDTKSSKPEPANDAAKDGYTSDYLVSRSKDVTTGRQRFTQYAIFIVGDRAEVAMQIGYGSQERLDVLGSGFDALLRSMEFRSAGAPPPARPTAALPTDMAAITPNQEASSQSSARQASAPGECIKAGPGEVCGVEQQPRTRFNNLFRGGGTTSIYYVPVYVCRKR